jgi:hypothetical protein
MSEYEVMRLAGHSDFTTTHKFYLTVADGLVDRARVAVPRACVKLWCKMVQMLFEFKIVLTVQLVRRYTATS